MSSKPRRELTKTSAATAAAPPPDALAFERLLLDRLHHWLTSRASPAPLDVDADLTREPWLWAETASVVHAMMGRGVLRWLTGEGGWQKQPYVEGDLVKQGRIWETSAFRGLVMRWSATSVSALVALNAVPPLTSTPKKQPSTKTKNAAASAPDQRAQQNPDFLRVFQALDPVASPAEQFAFFLIAGGLSKHGEPGEMMRKGLVQRLGMSRVLFGPLLVVQGDVLLCQAADVEAWAKAWGWTFPWLARRWSARWCEADAGALSHGLERFGRVMRFLSTAMSSLCDAAETLGRLEWVLPVITFFMQAYAQDQAPRMSLLGALMRQLKISERQDIQDTWGALLRVMYRLDQARVRIQRTHPADREPSERLLISYWQAHNVQPTAERVDALRQALERVLG